MTGGYLAGREFKDRLKAHRLALAKKRGTDIRPADVARAMGITRSAYGHWENGLREPQDVYTVEKLAAYLGVESTDFGLDLAALPQRKPPAKGERGREKDVRPKRPSGARKAQGE